MVQPAAGLAALTLLAAPGAAQSDGEALFQINCASCHGANGDGKGWTALDRPARSFRDGGFSFGNTPEALFRTITYGIPGTPMPAFETSLSVEQRELLAEHVLKLGPPVELVDPERTVLVVHERPIFARGLLPPIAEGCQSVPRGLLCGRPEGFTFEYRADDVRLLGLRQGGFVNRNDWGGRGGTALEPLGRVVHLIEGGAPREPFQLAGPSLHEPLTAELKSTFVRGGDAGLSYDLVASGEVFAQVVEIPRPAASAIGAGFARSFELRALRDCLLAHRISVYGSAQRVDSLRTTSAAGEAREWTVRRRADGLYELVGVDLVADGRSYRQQQGVYDVRIPLRAGGEAELSVATIVAFEWSDEVRERFAAEAAR